jgi:hypothetical protein
MKLTQLAHFMIKLSFACSPVRIHSKVLACWATPG